MLARVFIDTSIFIYAFEFPNSNSNKIIGLLNKREIEAVVSTRVLKEVTKYFEKHHNLALARLFRRYIVNSCFIVSAETVKEITNKLRGQIKEKDLEQLAVVKKFKLKYLIAYDKDFEKVEEYMTPREFVRKFGLTLSKEEY